MNRRSALTFLALGGVAIAAAPWRAWGATAGLKVAVRSPWMANQVAVTRDGLLFLGLPRYAPDKPTPALVKRGAGGTLTPFPGNGWNHWQPGDDGQNAFVYLNSVHAFDDDTVWCVDQGSLSANAFGADAAVPRPGAQKIVQLDATSGDVLRVLRFDEDILPPGSQLNDLRKHGSMLYLTDSGLGALVWHDLSTGKSGRRLSGHPTTQASKTAAVPALLAHIKGGKTFTPPNADLIEVTADGTWLYWASPTGPFYRVRCAELTDTAVTDETLATQIETVANIAFSGGCAMDSLGNLYLSETATHRITVLSPTGKRETLVSSSRITRPDGSCIGPNRQLFIPVKVPQPTAPLGDGTVDAPFVIYLVDLPARIGTLTLGGSVTG